MSSFSAGNAGASQFIALNGNQGGGSKKQGTPSTIGRTSGIDYNKSYGNNRDVVFNVNQLGGVGRGRSMFSTSADGVKTQNGIRINNDKKVIIFMDADKDDLYSLNLMLAQHYFKNINIIGIVCDDGFLDYPQNVIMTNFWIYDILKMYNIDIYKGIHRDLYLKDKRFFPSDFISSFIDVMKKDFNYNPDKEPIYKDISELIDKINQIDDDIYVLTTGNVTSLSYIISNIRNTRVLKIYSMIGNYKVNGNVINPFNTDIVPNSEYNAYLDPDSFSKTIQLTNVNIVPLDCTNYAPLNENTISQIVQLGNNYKINTSDTFILDNYDNFVKLLNSTLLTVNTNTLYMWDSVAVLIFLGADIKQRYYKDNINISWTGQIIKGNYNNNIYNYIDYNAFLENIVKILFTSNVK